jgi:hypothetical protein
MMHQFEPSVSRAVEGFPALFFLTHAFANKYHVFDKSFAFATSKKDATVQCEQARLAVVLVASISKSPTSACCYSGLLSPSMDFEDKLFVFAQHCSIRRSLQAQSKLCLESTLSFHTLDIYSLAVSTQIQQQQLSMVETMVEKFEKSQGDKKLYDLYSALVKCAAEFDDANRSSQPAHWLLGSLFYIIFTILQ